MKIAVASGKGGTGKTSVAVSLALAAKDAGYDVVFADCDVEAPNAHIFLLPQSCEEDEFYMTIPAIDEDACNYCGKCRDICKFNAITVFGKTIMAFKDMCHGCLGCFRVCERGAIREDRRLIGTISQADADGISFFQGRVRVGEAMSSPLIKELRKRIQNGEKHSENCVTILDAPPGTSCPVMNTVKGVDYVVLVTEPTPFGLHDLGLAVESMRKMGLRMGVVINKAGLGDVDVEGWCRSKDVPVLMNIGFERSRAERYARGIPLIEGDEVLQRDFTRLLKEISR